LSIHYTTQFKKDYKRIKKQNKDPDKLKIVIEKLVYGEKLEPRHRDHQLSGNWKGHRDCHIELDCPTPFCILPLILLHFSIKSL